MPAGRPIVMYVIDSCTMSKKSRADYFKAQTPGRGGAHGGKRAHVVVKDLIQCVQKSDAKIEITITATNLIRIKYPHSSFNYRLSGANVANFNKIHCTVFEQQLFKK